MELPALMCAAAAAAAGYLMEFGLYAWQPDGSVDRKLKDGAKTLVGWLAGWRWGG